MNAKAPSAADTTPVTCSYAASRLPRRIRCRATSKLTISSTRSERTVSSQRMSIAAMWPRAART